MYRLTIRQKDMEFQIEMLRIQLDADWRLSWFLSILGIFISLMFIFPNVRFLPPFLIGFILLFMSTFPTWKDKKISKLKRDYL